MTPSDTQPSEQIGIFTERELALIKNCRSYVSNDPNGLPGHNLMVIIAKMSDALNLAMLSLDRKEMDKVARSIARRNMGTYGVGELPAQSSTDLTEAMARLVDAMEATHKLLAKDLRRERSPDPSEALFPVLRK